MIKNAHAAVVLHQLAIWKCVFFVIGTLGGSTLAALSGMDWATSDPQTKVMVCLGIFVSFSTTMGAFIDQSFKRAQDGADPITGLRLSNPPFSQKEKEVTQTTTVTERATTEPKTP